MCIRDRAHVDHHPANPGVHGFAGFVTQVSSNVVRHRLAEAARQHQDQQAVPGLKVFMRGIKAERASDLESHIVEINRLGDDAVETKLLGARLLVAGGFDTQRHDGDAFGAHVCPEHLRKVESSPLG